MVKTKKKAKDPIKIAIFGIRLGIIAIVLTFCMGIISLILPYTPIHPRYLGILYLIIIVTLLYNLRKIKD